MKVVDHSKSQALQWAFDVSAIAFMHDDVFRAYWDDEGVSAVALYVEPGVDVDEKVR